MNTVNSTQTTNTVTSAGAGSSDIKTAVKGLNSNYSDFLKLLTTQLQNQDPTAPADTNQITQQIASLSQVEQQINTNSNLQQLIGLMNSSQINNSVGYIGKQVDATGNQVSLSNNVAALVYKLPAEAKDVKVTITDSKGSTVFSGDGTKVAGRNQLLWDGTNTDTGTKALDGTYNFKVTATDVNGKDMTATTYTTGTVKAVVTQNGAASLSLGNLTIPMNSVFSVYTAGTNPGA